MQPTAPDLPVFVLVDDQIHSARLLSRTLRNARNPAQIVWIGAAKRAARTLATLLHEASDRKPDMIIVDLKTSSDATARFIADIREDANAAGITIVAIATGLDAELRNELISAGASAVFERLADLDAYRAEMAHLTSFWVRETRTWPIRA